MKKYNDLLAGYIPVLDNGYLRTIDKHAERGSDIGVFATEIALQFAPYTRKELRLLNPERVQALLQGIGVNAQILTLTDMQNRLSDERQNITLLDDDISRGLADSTPVQAKLTFDSPFLRWDRRNANVNQIVETGQLIESSELDQIFRALYHEANKSSDWWRHVAAAIIGQNGQLIAMQHNSAMPSEYMTSLESDPRILANRGSNIELSLFIHAETSCVAQAARQGASLEGSDLYVTVFPCPNCAKIIAASGIKRIYFAEGYAMLDGQRVLEECGVEIIRVKTVAEARTPAERLIPYPEK